jgi:hypothetical protein
VQARQNRKGALVHRFAGPLLPAQSPAMGNAFKRFADFGHKSSKVNAVIADTA